jgi:hypothetical protein
MIKSTGFVCVIIVSQSCVITTTAVHCLSYEKPRDMYLSETTVAESTMNAMPNAPTAPLLANSRLFAVHQRLQHAGTQAATISRDIRQYFPGRRSAS